MSSPAASAPAPLIAVTERLRRATEVVLSVRRAYVLGGLVTVQWLAVLAFALTVRHNGWLFYSGGDQLWHYTDAYVLGHRLQPPSFVGYGWSMLLLPLTPFAGPNLVSALPAIVLFNTVVLLPIALLCIYGIAARIGGRLFGYWAAAAVDRAALPRNPVRRARVPPEVHRVDDSARRRADRDVGFPEHGRTPDLRVPVPAGARNRQPAHDGRGRLCGGVLDRDQAVERDLPLRPRHCCCCSTRWRTVLPFVLGLAPVLATLALWKYRGLGHLGAANEEPVRLASGVGDLLRRIHNPDANSWSHFYANVTALREHFWVARVLEWLPVAGAIALFARSRRGLLLVAPLVRDVPARSRAAISRRAWTTRASSGSCCPPFPRSSCWWRQSHCSSPASRAQPAPVPPTVLKGRRLLAAAAAAVAVFAIFPVVVIAAAKQVGDEAHMLDYGDTLVPVRDLGLKAMQEGDAVRLTWNDQHVSPAKIFYTVLRTNRPAGGVTCAHVTGASVDCRLEVDKLFPTRATSLTDSPGPGTWSYRVTVSANWLNDTQQGDAYVVSPPVVVTVP